jgi:LysR family transcriptional activator of nhaA
VRADFDRLMAREGLSPRIAAEADDMAMLRLLVRENAGLALVPPIVIQDELEAGILVEALRLRRPARGVLGHHPAPPVSQHAALSRDP